MLWPVALVLFSELAWADWENHRGDPSLQGISSDHLGDELNWNGLLRQENFLNHLPLFQQVKFSSEVQRNFSCT